MIHIILHVVFLGIIFNLLMQIDELKKAKESVDKDHKERIIFLREEANAVSRSYQGEIDELKNEIYKLKYQNQSTLFDLRKRDKDSLEQEYRNTIDDLKNELEELRSYYEKELEDQEYKILKKVCYKEEGKND